MDITKMKMLQMQLEEEKEKYEIVEDISDNILFNYDVVSDVFYNGACFYCSLPFCHNSASPILTFWHEQRLPFSS